MWVPSMRGMISPVTGLVVRVTRECLPCLELGGGGRCRGEEEGHPRESICGNVNSSSFVNTGYTGWPPTPGI